MTAPAVVGPWAREKLDALGRYLGFYTTALKNQRWRTIYVDAYAGGGRAVVRVSPSSVDPNQLALLEPEQTDAEQAELLNGSPRIALAVADPFDLYVFIESDPTRVAELEALGSEFGVSRHIVVRHETAPAGIEWLLAQPMTKRTHRGVVFVDPFGADLDWSMIEAIGRSGFLEVVVNFSLHMGIQRRLPNNGSVPVEWASRLTAYFGTPRWREAVYEQASGDLFRGTGARKRVGYQLGLLELYRTRLKEAFGNVSVPKLIRNTRGAPLYYLLWAGPHSLGLKGADYILGMAEAVPKPRRR
jgi:three-Cys-motif partner protein